ncbi:MAG TPA: hypothetical protein VEL76_20405, partial [Gemmataceae bacterium]|nr:hypothetical protein [Gemmataceae bacterium]
MPVLHKLLSPLNLVRAGGCASDTGDYLDVAITSGTGVSVTVRLLPTLPATGLDSVRGGPIQVDTTPLSTGTPANVSFTTSPAGIATDIQFALGNNTGEVAGSLHKLVVTAFGNDSSNTTFTFYYYILDPTTTTTTTT